MGQNVIATMQTAAALLLILVDRFLLVDQIPQSVGALRLVAPFGF
jgi:hypothetical protein